MLILDNFQELYKFYNNSNEGVNSINTLKTVKLLGRKDNVSIMICGNPQLKFLINGTNRL